MLGAASKLRHEGRFALGEELDFMALRDGRGGDGRGGADGVLDRGLSAGAGQVRARQVEEEGDLRRDAGLELPDDQAREPRASFPVDVPEGIAGAVLSDAVELDTLAAGLAVGIGG